MIGEDYKTWGKGKVVIEATTGTGKTSFVMGPLMDWALAETLRMNFPRQMLILCNRRALKADIMAKFEARCEPHIFMNEFGEPDCLEYDIVTIATYQHFEKRLKYTKDKGRAIGSYKIIVLDECHYFFDDSSFNENTAALYQTLKRTGGKRAGCLDDSYTRKHVQRMEETGTAGTGTLLHADTKSGAHNKGMDILQRCRTDRYY